MQCTVSPRLQAIGLELPWEPATRLWSGCGGTANPFGEEGPSVLEHCVGGIVSCIWRLGKHMRRKVGPTIVKPAPLLVGDASGGVLLDFRAYLHLLVERVLVVCQTQSPRLHCHHPLASCWWVKGQEGLVDVPQIVVVGACAFHPGTVVGSLVS